MYDWRIVHNRYCTPHLSGHPGAATGSLAAATDAVQRRRFSRDPISNGHEARARETQFFRCSRHEYVCLGIFSYPLWPHGLFCWNPFFGERQWEGVMLEIAKGPRTFIYILFFTPYIYTLPWHVRTYIHNYFAHNR